MRPAIRIARRQEEFFQLIRLREEVFVIEQGVPLDIELDEADDRAVHFIATAKGEVIGTARLVVRGRAGKIGRMAVQKKWRGKGVGAALIGLIKKTAVKKGITRLYLHAQASAVPFYQRLGFVAEGKGFVEAGIPHRKMVLKEKG